MIKRAPDGTQGNVVKDEKKRVSTSEQGTEARDGELSIQVPRPQRIATRLLVANPSAMAPRGDVMEEVNFHPPC